jgi:hypothetical protein
MYIHPTPLLTFSRALASLAAGTFQCGFWKTYADDQVEVFSRGQWAIAEFAVGLCGRTGATKCGIFIPEYFCEISLTPLRRLGFDLHFYRLTPEFTPDSAHLNELAAKHGSPALLLYVHYFGFPSSLEETAGWCRKNGVVLLEDAAHSLGPLPGIGGNGNATLYTPWKFLGVPRGAVLVLPAEIDVPRREKVASAKGADGAWGWLGKQAVFSLVRQTGFPLHRLRKVRIKTHDESEPVVEPGSSAPDTCSLRILAGYEGYLEAVRRRREEHYRRLDEIFSRNDRTRGLRLFQHLPPSFGPYLYPLRVPQEVSRELMIALNGKGIPALPWSDLSPEVKGSPTFPLANALRREVVTLPIHQDLSVAEIEWMAKETVLLLGKFGIHNARP